MRTRPLKMGGGKILTTSSSGTNDVRLAQVSPVVLHTGGNHKTCGHHPPKNPNRVLLKQMYPPCFLYILIANQRHEPESCMLPLTLEANAGTAPASAGYKSATSLTMLIGLTF